MRLNNVVIATNDYQAMLAFYKTLTGWPILFESPACCFLGQGAPYLAIHPVGADTEVAPPERTMCLDFEVPDLAVEAERLSRLGYEPERRGDLLVLRDPAGNLIEITQGKFVENYP